MARKYRVIESVPVQKKTLFGTRTVWEKRAVYVDRETYDRIVEEERKRDREDGFSLEEMMFYDEIFDDD